MMTRRAFSLLLVAFSFLALFHTSDAFALWAKAFGGVGDDVGGIAPTGDGNYFLQSLTDSFGAGKNDLLLSKLNSSGAVQWTKTFGGSDDDELFTTTLTEGGFFVWGTTKSFGSGGDDILWAKLDSSGAPVYQKVFGGVRDESGGFSPTKDGGFIFTGESNSYGPDGTDRDILIIKINSLGNIEWSKVIHHGLKDSSSGILEISDGYILTASVENTTTIFGKDILVVKLDLLGNIVWKKLYGGNGINTATIADKKTSDGGYILFGSTKSDLFNPNSDILLLKLNASGDIQWQKKYSGEGLNTITSVTETSDGFILNGTSIDLTTFNSTILLMKVNSSGGIIWEKGFGGAGSVSGFLQKTDGGYLLSGSTSSISDPPNFDLLFAKLDSNFNFLWQKTFGGSGVDIGGVVGILNNNTYFLTGSTDSFGAGKTDVFGITLDSNGNFTGCAPIKDISLNTLTPSLIEGDASLVTSEPNLTLRAAGAASNINMTIGTPTIPETVICAGGPSSQPDITANPGSVNFGNVNVGSTSDQTVTIRNDGTADLIIGTITSPPAPFSKLTDSCSGQTLTPVQTCTITYRYAPTSAGISAGNSNIPSNDPDNNLLTVSLNGTGVAIAAPDTLIDTSPSNPSTSTSATFTFHATGAGSSFECQMDGGGYAGCTSPKSYPGPLANGSHTFQVRAKDATGNVDPTPASYTWTINTPPDTLINLLNPSNGQEFTTCSNPPKFQWNTSETFKSIEVQFSLQNNFSAIPVKAKGKPGVNELQITSALWKKLLLLPGTQGGTVYWKVVGTKANKSKEESNIFSMEIGAPEPVGDPNISPTSKASLPTLSWQNQCNTKFKAWFGNDPNFTKPGMKKKAYSFTDTDPNDNGGAFTKGLTSGQWTAIRKLVGNVSGATLYWYVESWDGVNRHSTTGVTSFVLGN